MGNSSTVRLMVELFPFFILPTKTLLLVCIRTISHLCNSNHFRITVRTHILEPLEFDAKTASKDEIAHNKSLKETALKIYKLIDEYDKGDSDLGMITMDDFFLNYHLLKRNT